MFDPDTKLMLRLAEGDTSAFKQIMNKHKKMVMNIAYRLLQDQCRAEDITQEVFIRVLNCARSYQPRAKLSTWLYKITTDLCLNDLRAQKRSKGVSLETIGEIPDLTHADPMESYERARIEDLVRDSLNSLPDRQKVVVILQKYEGLSYQQISEIMECSVSAVDSLLQRAKQNLRNKIAPFLTNKSEGFH